MTETRAAYDVPTKPVDVGDLLDADLIAELNEALMEVYRCGFGKVVIVVTNRQVEFIEIRKRKRRKNR
jgi:hypothetical protein